MSLLEKLVVIVKAVPCSSTDISELSATHIKQISIDQVSML